MYLRLLPKPCMLLSIVSSNKTTSQPKIACTWDYRVIDYPTLAIIAVWWLANGFEVGRRWTPFCNKWAPCSTPTNSSNGWFLPTLLHTRARASDESRKYVQICVAIKKIIRLLVRRGLLPSPNDHGHQWLSHLVLDVLSLDTRITVEGGGSSDLYRWDFRLVPLRPEQENVRMEALFEKAILKIVSSSFKMIAMKMCSLIHWAQNWNNEIVRLVVHPKDAWATTLAAHNVITCIDGLCSNSILYTGFDQYILVSFLITLSPSEKCSVFVADGGI